MNTQPWSTSKISVISSAVKFAVALLLGAAITFAAVSWGATGCSGGGPAKISTGEVEPLVRERVSTAYPDLGEDMSLEINELDVPGLWDDMHIQLFSAESSSAGSFVGPAYFVYRDGRLTPFPWVRDSGWLLSAAVVDGKFYYTFAWGSGIFYQGIGALSVEGEGISSVQSPHLERGTPAGAAMFVKQVDGRAQVELGSPNGLELNSWEPRQDMGPVGWVELRASSLVLVDAPGAEIDWQELNAVLGELSK